MPVFYSEPKNINIKNPIISSNTINLGNPSDDVDTIYIAAKNISKAQNALSLSGGIGFGITVPNAHVDGIQYIFLDSLTRLSGDIILNIIGTGSSLEVLKLYLLKELFMFDDDETFVRIDMGKQEIGAIIHEDLYFGESKVQGNFKRRVAYTAKEQTQEKYRLFELFRENNPHFYFLEDYLGFNDLPERLYPAMLGRDLDTRYSLTVKSEGFDVDFDIRER